MSDNSANVFAIADTWFLPLHDSSLIHNSLPVHARPERIHNTTHRDGETNSPQSYTFDSVTPCEVVPFDIKQLDFLWELRGLYILVQITWLPVATGANSYWQPCQHRHMTIHRYMTHRQYMTCCRYVTANTICRKPILISTLCVFQSVKKHGSFLTIYYPTNTQILWLRKTRSSINKGPLGSPSLSSAVLHPATWFLVLQSHLVPLLFCVYTIQLSFRCVISQIVI
jgi:hypothetical protein